MTFKTLALGWLKLAVPLTTTQIDMRKCLKHNQPIVGLSRFLTVGLSALALVLSLLGSSLFHVHRGGGHESDHPGFRGTLVHSHLPQALSNERESDDPSFESPSHDGASIDLFLSLGSKQAPVAVGVKIDPGVIRQQGTPPQRGTYRFDRTHDPPPRSISPRAPPV